MNKVLVRLYASLEIELTRIGPLRSGAGHIASITVFHLDSQNQYFVPFIGMMHFIAPPDRLVRMLSLGHENALASIIMLRKHPLIRSCNRIHNILGDYLGGKGLYSLW